MKIDLTQEWRCYHFGNFYLSSIQQGIQSAHAQMELFNKYCPHIYNDNQVEDQPAIDMLFTWSNKHKTMICLSGGDLNYMTEIKNTICVEDNIYPHTTFNESEEALGGILTNIAIVLPLRIFGAAEQIRSGKLVIIGNELHHKPIPNDTFGGYRPEKLDVLSDIEVKIIEILCNTGLAR